MYPERYRMPLWTRLTSIAVISALITGCIQKTMGYVTPTPEGATTPVTEPYCDSHMLTIEPPLDMNQIDPQNLPILVENLMGPSGVGEIKGISMVKNPTKEYVSNVVRSVQEHQDQVEGITPSQAQVVEFGMNGEASDFCAPLTMVLGAKNADGTQKAYLGFAEKQLDADDNGVPDLVALVPSFDGNIDRFLELGQVDSNPEDNKVHVGPIDQLDPESIQPLFEIDKVTGEVVFLPPFYQGETQPASPVVPSEFGGNFLNVSFNPDSVPQGQETVGPTPTPSISEPTVTATNEATATPEVAQFNICQIEQYKDCKITVEQLFNGDYLNWLNTLSKPFDPTKINDVPFVHYTSGDAVYQVQTAPNFTVDGSEPFRRDVTAGLVSYQGRDYLVMPIEFFDKNNPDKNQWVITVHQLFNDTHAFTDAEIEQTIKLWRTEFNTTPFVDRNVAKASGIEDPLVSLSFQKYPDLVDLVDKFADYGNSHNDGYGDRSALSKPGIVLLNFIYVSQKPWYK